MSFPYLLNSSRLKDFFGTIQNIGVPDKFTVKVVESLGYKSKSDRAYVTLLKELGFLDSSGAPQPRWLAYRDRSDAPKILAGAIREAYSDIFKMYPDAERKDDEAIRNVIKSKSELADATVAFVVRTFRVLCDIANFELAALNGANVVQPTNPTETAGQVIAGLPKTTPSGMVVNLNIQLQIPETSDIVVFENFFKAMRKHLLGDA